MNIFFDLPRKTVNTDKVCWKLYKKHFTSALILKHGTFEDEGHALGETQGVLAGSARNLVLPTNR